MEMTGILSLVLAAAAAFAGWKYVHGKKTIFYKGIMPSEKGFRFSSGL